MAPDEPLSARLRAQYAAQCAADASVAVLVQEACRIADRLDALDEIVTGKAEWIELMKFRMRLSDDVVVEVKFDNVLAEARQQASALRGLMAQLGAGKAGAVKTAAKEVDPLDALAARRAARGAGATSRQRRAGNNPG